MGEVQGFNNQQGGAKEPWGNRVLNWGHDISAFVSFFAIACGSILLISNTTLSNFLWVFLIIAVLCSVLSLFISKYADRLEKQGFYRAGKYINWFAVALVAAGGIIFALVIMNFLP